MNNVYKDIDNYNDIIADIIHNKKLNSIIIELFIRG